MINLMLKILQIRRKHDRIQNTKDSSKWNGALDLSGATNTVIFDTVIVEVKTDFQVIYEMMGKLPRQTMKSKIEFCEDSSSDFLFHFELYTCLHGGKVFYLFDEQGALKAIGGEG